MTTQLTLLSRSEVTFPDPETALPDPNGLLAAGGELTTEWLLKAYRLGIFPWFEDDGSIPLWWSPDPRAVLYPAQFHASRSLRKRLHRKEFTLSFDQSFAAVIDACASPRKETQGTWITGQMKHAYLQLHRLGYAHSVETWQNGLLVGGLYGISLGRMFFGESMFSKVADASKVALATLAKHLQIWQFSLIDCQLMNEHLASLGAQEISRSEFLGRVKDNNLIPDLMGVWHLEAAE